jgi:chromosome segregation ATPase
MLTACVQNSSEYKQLLAENDSLKVENSRKVSELDEMLSLLDDIQADFQSIRDAESYLTITQQGGGELTPTTREQINNNMQMISETLRKNKEQIGQLETKLKNSNIQSAALKKTIDRLTSELDQKTTMIIALQEDLEKKNIHIRELGERVATLSEDLENLSVSNAVQAESLKSQDKTINTAYYCFGTAKELKNQKILTGGGLFSKAKVLKGDFNRDYFIAIDLREVTEIPLFAAKASLKSNHPAGSYEFVKDEDKNLSFKITDPKAFWSLGRYLVIEVG